jgi:hypothetical protein
MSLPLPNDGMEWDEILSQFISLSCISVLSVLFGAKSTAERLRHLTYARLLVLVIYIVSWAFTAASTLLVATNNYNQISCTLSIITCDVFYAGSKILIYAWYLIHSSIVTIWRANAENAFFVLFYLSGSLNVSGSYKPWRPSEWKLHYIDSMLAYSCHTLSFFHWW